MRRTPLSGITLMQLCTNMVLAIKHHRFVERENQQSSIYRMLDLTHPFFAYLACENVPCLGKWTFAKRRGPLDIYKFDGYMRITVAQAIGDVEYAIGEVEQLI
ncbi:hypothetical protein O0I10_012651 [Lichtheimia ornata]|uniref:Uncharacterized protein n=1 Tax=Lichtheimia ornata TaxID=688661 RepID=A0AAD7UQM9_9FUNG|nr:uncharacterized protein O0I10_012651 [Lichtheimia ornata]KAJ8651774.1 hypothetical protein O0I10_012651 [Lichtheimia ornata]